MNKDERLMEELLKEHARKGSGADEDFLKEVEERIDTEEKVVVMQKKDSPGSRWALGTGIAACLALGVGGIYFWQQRQDERDIIAYDDTASGQIEAQSEASDMFMRKGEAKPEELAKKSEVLGEEVKRDLYLAEANLNLGHLDESERHYREVLRKDNSNLEARRGLEKLAAEKSDYYRAAYDHTRAGMLEGVDSTWEIEIPENAKLGNDVAGKPLAPASVPTKEIPTFMPKSDIKDSSSIELVDKEFAVRGAQGGKLAGASDYAKFNAEVRGYEKAREALTKMEAAGADAGAILKQQLVMDEHRNRLAVMSQKTGIPYSNLLKPELSREQYGGLVENRFKAPVDERSALSTFAVDVDTASYANVRRMINEDVRVPKDAVRVEEMINYFDYQYAQPEGEHPFAVQVDSAACPWNEKHRIVRIGVQGKDIVREERPGANLVFLLDVSGSMSSPNKLPLLKQSMNFLLEELNERDSVSIVVYAGASGLALPATKMDDVGRQQVADALEKLSAGGSTAGGEGIKLAYKIAKEQFKKDGVNRIILATDGDFNVGMSDTDSLTKMVKEEAKGGTYLSVLGFGSGNINDNMLESITNNGNGNYNYIDSLKEGRKVLLEDMMGTMVTIAKDVKVQVVMNPKKVKAYRLIGYANRMLPPEAFLDKKVDAGEIGAGHTVTALYEIIPADGKPFGPEIDGSRYFEKPEEQPNPAVKDSDETMFVKLAYKKPEQKMEDESTYFSVPFTDKGTGIKEASADLKFASAVGLFGMVLRDSEYKGGGDLSTVLELATAGKGNDGKGQREEFIKLVQKLNEKE